MGKLPPWGNAEKNGERRSIEEYILLKPILIIKFFKKMKAEKLLALILIKTYVFHILYSPNKSDNSFL